MWIQCKLSKSRCAASSWVKILWTIHSQLARRFYVRNYRWQNGKMRHKKGKKEKEEDSMALNVLITGSYEVYLQVPERTRPTYPGRWSETIGEGDPFREWRCSCVLLEPTTRKTYARIDQAGGDCRWNRLQRSHQIRRACRTYYTYLGIPFGIRSPFSLRLFFSHFFLRR